MRINWLKSMLYGSGLLIWVLIYQSPLIVSGAKVSFLDVGQGDSILIRSGKGQTVLIDGGPDVSVITELGTVLPVWEREIDIVVLTHAHDDHLLGLFDVLKRFSVKVVIVREKTCDSKVCHELLMLCKELEIKILDLDSLEPPYQIVLDDLSLSFWWSKNETLLDNINNSSVVTVLFHESGRFSAILTGDLEEGAEYELINASSFWYQIVATHVTRSSSSLFTVLKAGHHCSRTASSDDFLRTTKPLYVLCSLGKDNRFGHPHEETIERLRNTESTVLRTDLDGRVTFYIENGRVERERLGR